MPTGFICYVPFFLSFPTLSLPEVHRLSDRLRIESAKEWLSREFMTVPERIPV